ncbi:MAG: hypothetical protein N4A68_10905 [Maledivibacter sp.]|nr:hypothetical protein [Maledivibacter sp.]
MKIKNKKDIWIFIFLIPIFLWLSLNFSGDKNNKSIPYSVLNKGSKGVSVIYEAMKELGYPVKLDLNNIEDKDYDNIQFVILSNYNSRFDINDDSIKAWIKMGGKLVCLYEDIGDIRLDYGKKIDSFTMHYKDSGSVFSYGDGRVLIGDSGLINNKALSRDTDGAYWILKQIDEWGYSRIEFNEFYHYSGGKKKSLWEDMPKGIKFMLYQVAFLIASIIFYKGKRFGKPIPLYEEVERTENEYILSVASLYQKAGCWEVVFESYYRDFLLEVQGLFGKNECIDEEWLELWEKKKLSRFNKAKELYDFKRSEISHIKNKKKKSKKYLEMISIIESLKKIIMKRREDHWKRLKKDIQKI